MNGSALLSPLTGEFVDNKMEKLYLASSRQERLHQLRLAFVAVGSLYPSLLIVDYLVIGLNWNFYLMAILRASVALPFWLLFLHSKRSSRLLDSRLPLNAVSFLLATSTLLIGILRPDTLVPQLAGVILLTVFFYFFIPGSLLQSLAFCLYLAIGFLLCLVFLADIPTTGVASAALVLAVTNITGLASTARLHRSQRKQYSSLLAEQKANRLLEKEIEQRKHLEAELRHWAQVDDLTGLNNRRNFIKLAEQELRHSHRKGTPLSVLMLDLDHFKTVNDKWGHSAGDMVLAQMARLSQQELRKSDIMGRFGGEEFMIALPETSAQAAVDVAERIRAGIEGYQLPEEFSAMSLTATIGISEVRPDEDSLEPAVQRADKALYKGKRQGRNQVVISCS